MRVHRVLLTAVGAVFLAACSGSSTPGRTSGPSVTPSSHVETPAPTATPIPTARTPSVETVAPTIEPTPAPRADVSVVREVIIPWEVSSSLVRWNIIVEVRNRGTGWAQIVARSSDFTIFARNGDVLDTGSFSYAFPRYLAPGQTGYIAQDSISDSFKLSEVGRLETSTSWIQADKADVVVLKTSKIRNSRDSYDGSYTTSGTVTNPGTQRLASVHVGAFYLDAKGKPLGFSWTDVVENLGPGQSKGFKTVSDLPPIRTKVAKTVVFASWSD